MNAQDTADNLAGFLAASNGEPRDNTQSHAWLHAYDATLLALEQATKDKAELDAQVAALPKYVRKPVQNANLRQVTLTKQNSPFKRRSFYHKY